jgi:hypothetical protein
MTSELTNHDEATHRMLSGMDLPPDSRDALVPKEDLAARQRLWRHAWEWIAAECLRRAAEDEASDSKPSADEIPTQPRRLRIKR